MTDKEVCLKCDAEYEGNEPRNCMIYEKTRSCKFVKEDGTLTWEVKEV
jgi:hypothetical protein